MMPTRLQPLFQSNAIVVEVDLCQSFLRSTWLAQPEQSDYREITSRIATYTLEHNIQRALFDVRQRSYLEVSNQNWIRREMLPLFHGRHVKLAYLTTIPNLQMLDTLRMQETVEETPGLGSSFQIEIFLDMEEAMQWLQD